MSKRGDAFDPTELLKARVSASGQEHIPSDTTSIPMRLSASGYPSLNGTKKYRPTPTIKEVAEPVANMPNVRRLPTKMASRRGDLFDPSSLIADVVPAPSFIPPVISEVDEPAPVLNGNSSEKAKALSLRITEMEKKLVSMDQAYEIAEELLKSKEAAIIEVEGKLELALLALSEAERAAEDAKARLKADEKALEHAASTTADLLNAAMSASEERQRDLNAILDLKQRKISIEREIARLQQ
jgi:hypothetical protein